MFACFFVCVQFKDFKEWDLLSSDQHQQLYINVCLPQLKASIVSKGWMMKEWLVTKSHANHDKRTMECYIQAIVHLSKMKAGN